MANRKKSKKLSALITAVLVILAALVYILYGEQLSTVLNSLELVKLSTLYTKPVPEGELEVHVIDVGQGDSILVRSSAGNILIDAGSVSTETKLRVYLHAIGIKTLDYFICTHPHEDHVGGAAMIVESFRVGTLLMPDARSEEYCFLDLETAIKEKDVTVLNPAAGEEFSLGDIRFEILGPIKPTDNLNNMSLIVKMTFGERSFLFTGDAEAEAEQALLEAYDASRLDCDFCKIGHHGSNTSSSVDFLHAVTPEIAVISCGDYNEHGHPHGEILERLKEAGTAAILRTDQMDTIVIACDGEEITVKP